MASTIKRVWKTWIISKIAIISSIIILPIGIAIPSVFMPKGLEENEQTKKVISVQNDFSKALEYCNKYQPSDLLFYTSLYHPYFKELYGTKFDQVSYNNSISIINKWENPKKEDFLNSIKTIKFNEISDNDFHQLSTSFKNTINFLNTADYSVYANLTTLFMSIGILSMVLLLSIVFICFIAYGLKIKFYIYFILALLLVFFPLSTIVPVLFLI